MKSVEEIVEQLAEIIHRHRRRYIRKNTRPCPNNCAYADGTTKKGVTGCGRCGSTNPEHCRMEPEFVPLSTKEEVIEQFRRDLRDPNVLRHEYRDILTLGWVLGLFDGEEPVEHLIAAIEQRAPGGKGSEA